jgi:hypothetical protein
LLRHECTAIIAAAGAVRSIHSGDKVPTDLAQFEADIKSSCYRILRSRQHLAGTDKGPPLVHNIYNPGHHAAGAFFLAAKTGVRSHHWPYGDMPPQPQMSEAQVGGIGYQPHRM